MLATVRNRRGVVAAVEPFDGETGRLHLVHLEYTDDHAPAEERLLWELKPSRHLVPPDRFTRDLLRNGGYVTALVEICFRRRSSGICSSRGRVSMNGRPAGQRTRRGTSRTEA